MTDLKSAFLKACDKAWQERRDIQPLLELAADVIAAAQEQRRAQDNDSPEHEIIWRVKRDRALSALREGLGEK